MQLDLIITLRKDYIKWMPSILESFKSDGFSISRVTDYGVVMGRGDKDFVVKWSGAKEVESVIEDTYTQLPSPDSSVQ